MRLVMIEPVLLRFELLREGGWLDVGVVPVDLSDALLWERIGTLGVLGERKKPMPLGVFWRRLTSVVGVPGRVGRADALGEILVLETVALRCRGFFRRAMEEDGDCDLAGEEEAMELGSFDGIREVLAGDEGAEVRTTTGAST